jgi:3-oxoacyl-[acyl-carrier-protein] synthase-1
MVQQSQAMETLVITAIDGRTPVGPSIEDSAAAVKAGVSGFREHPDYNPILKNDEEDYLVSAGIDLSITEFGWQRLIQFVEKPFLSFMANIGLKRTQMTKTALWFALPYADPAVQQIGLQKFFINHFIKHYALPGFADIAGVQLGASGVIHLLNKARESLSSGLHDHIIIVAIDSFMLDGRMAYYDDQWRLKSQRNPMGFMPGEATAMILVETHSHAVTRNKNPLMTLTGFGIDQESNPISAEKASTGQGLGQAVERALSENEIETINWLYSDLNGESYRAYEWAIVNTRLASRFGAELNHVHSADVMGDVGAATTAVQLGCIAHAFKEDYAEDDNALLIASNDNGQRAALSVTRSETE